MKHLSLCLIAFVLILFSGISAETPKGNGISCDPKVPCWICTPSLREKGRLWCKEHDRYENRCWLCHPEMQDKERLYCKEHGIYEDECSLCHPEITKQKNIKQCLHKVDKKECLVCTPSKRTKGRLWCKEHSRYEDRCWLCHPELKEKGRAYCKEHFLYEDECHFCNSNLKKGDPKSQCLHKVDKSECLVCTPSKRTKGRLWCKEHSRYEDRCWLCHPELKEKGRAYCKEHFLYEDECHFCNSNLKKNTQSFNSINRLECREHDVFEDECAICHPELASDLNTGRGMKIRFASKESTTKAGVETSLPRVLSGIENIEAYTEITYDKNNLVQITPLTEGVVLRVLVDVGDEIKKGDALVEISSTEVAKAKQNYVQSLLDEKLSKEIFSRQNTLHDDGISSLKMLRKDESYYERAKLKTTASYQALLNLGFTKSEVDEVAKKNNTDTKIILRSPFDGTVVERSVVMGQAVDRSSHLIKVANLEQMWFELSMKTRDLMLLRKGQKLTASFQEFPLTTFEGIITWIDTRIDPRSRMLKARAVVSNKNRVLKSGIFGKSQIHVSEETKGFGVPLNAIHQLSANHFIFIKEDDDLYAARKIQLGPKIGKQMLVTAGLEANEEVVINGSHIVYSEMFKSKLGAGCVDD